MRLELNRAQQICEPLDFGIQQTENIFGQTVCTEREEQQNESIFGYQIEHTHIWLFEKKLKNILI